MALGTFSQHFIGGSSQEIKRQREIKGIQIRKEEFAGDVIANTVPGLFSEN